jgi:hypothetical protein
MSADDVIAAGYVLTILTTSGLLTGWAQGHDVQGRLLQCVPAHAASATRSDARDACRASEASESTCRQQFGRGMHAVQVSAAVASRFGLPFHTVPFTPCSPSLPFAAGEQTDRFLASVSYVAHVMPGWRETVSIAAT